MHLAVQPDFGHSASRGTIEAIYGAIVAQARRRRSIAISAFPTRCMAGSTWWCCICGWCCASCAERPATELAQALVDHFCSDMDDNLRELGVGDLRCRSA